MSQTLGATDIIKGVCASGAALVFGAVILWGPDEVRKEISDTWRYILGGGLVSVGAVFAATMVFATGAGRRSQAIAGRLKGLLLAMVCGAILAAAVMTKGREIHTAWRLSESAAAADAVVLERKMKLAGKKVRYVYDVRFDGHRVSISLPHTAQRGDHVPVLYLPDRPESALYGKPGDGFVAIVDQSMGRWTAIFVAAIVLISGLAVLGGLWTFCLGAPRDPAAATQ